MNTPRIPIIDAAGNGVSLETEPRAEQIDYPWTEIGKGISEYRGYFVSKSNSGRDWTVLEPAPSRNAFGYFKNLWDVEEAIDAFCDKGIEPGEGE